MNKNFIKKSAGVAAATGAWILSSGAALAKATPAPACDLTTLAGSAACGKTSSSASSLATVISIVSSTIAGLVGAVAVLFLIIGGLNYVTSQGDQKKVESAKNTILYAVIGIVVVIMSYALVQFVIGQFAGK